MEPGWARMPDEPDSPRFGGAADDGPRRRCARLADQLQQLRLRHLAPGYRLLRKACGGHQLGGSTLPGHFHGVFDGEWAGLWPVFCGGRGHSRSLVGWNTPPRDGEFWSNLSSRGSRLGSQPLCHLRGRATGWRGHRHLRTLQLQLHPIVAARRHGQLDEEFSVDPPDRSTGSAALN